MRSLLRSGPLPAGAGQSGTEARTKRELDAIAWVIRQSWRVLWTSLYWPLLEVAETADDMR